MSTSPKIDLSSIMKKKNTQTSSNSTEVKNTENNIIKKSTNKISINTIKTTKLQSKINKDESNKNEEKHENKEGELTKTLDQYKSELEEINKNKKTLEKINNNNSEKKVNLQERNIDSLQSKKNKKLISDSILSSTKKNVVGEKKEELFGNYKSDFIEKEHVIIGNIEEKRKNFRERLKEPKTRIILVLSLIALTGIVIVTLFILDPKNHSLEKYQTIISKNIKNFKITFIDEPWINEKISIETYSFDIFTQEKRSGKHYKYKGVIYQSKIELNKILNNEVVIKKEKLAEIKAIEAKKIKLEQEKVKLEQEKIERKKIKDLLLEKFR